MPDARRCRVGLPSWPQTRTLAPPIPSPTMVLVYILGALTVLSVIGAAVVAVGLEGKD
jgi:hypothetical protein